MSHRFSHLFCATATLLALAFTSTSAQAQFTFNENFDGTTLNPNLSINSALGTGYTVSLTGGQLVLTKPAGVTTFGVYVNTKFKLVGDFTVDVQTTHIPNDFMSVGVATNGTVGAYTDVYYAGNNGGIIQANFFLPDFNSVATVVHSSTTTFRIQRTGNTVIDQYYDGVGFVTVNSRSDPSLGADAGVSLLFLDEIGNSAASQAMFDNFSITAAGVVYPGVTLSGAVTLLDCTDPEQNITFEFRPKPSGTPFKVKQVLEQSGPNSGTFSLPNIPPGTYDIAVKGYCWLQQVIPNVVVSGNVSGLTATLWNGDLNGDNVVDIADFGILVNNYSSAGDP